MMHDHMITKTSSKCHLPLIFEARYDFPSWVQTVTGPRPGESIGRLQPITGEDVTFCMAARISVHSSSRSLSRTLGYTPERQSSGETVANRSYDNESCFRFVCGGY